MALTIRSSLFDPEPQPVLESSVGWMNDVLFGQVALSLCVLAVACIGLLMLMGRLPIREGMRVVVGCFVLLGAPAIAAAFASGGSELASTQRPSPPMANVEPSREELPPASYDPYAGASLRQD